MVVASGAVCGVRCGAIRRGRRGVGVNCVCDLIKRRQRERSQRSGTDNVRCRVAGSVKAELRIVEVDVACVAMSIVFGDGVDGSPVGEIGVLVEGGHDGGMVEAVSLDFDGEGVHGGSHVFSVADLIGRAVHGGETKVVGLAGCAVMALDLQVRHGDISTGARKCAATMVDFGVAWGFLVGLGAEAASFLEVVLFACGCARGLTDVDLRELDVDAWGNGGDFINEVVESLVVGGEGKIIGPDAVGHRGFLHPAVRCGELASFFVKGVAGSPSVLHGVRLGSVVERSDFAPAVVSGELLDFLIESDWWRRGNPTIVAGELLGFGVECARRGFWWGWNPSVVASETLGIVVEDGWGWGWDWSPSIVAGDLLELVVERDPGECGNKRQSCGVGGGVSEG